MKVTGPVTFWMLGYGVGAAAPETVHFARSRSRPKLFRPRIHGCHVSSPLATVLVQTLKLAP